MKNILVPTDFSECAGYALDAAVQFARRFHATIHLYTRLPIPGNWDIMTDREKLAFPEAFQYVTDTQSKFAGILKKYPDLTIQINYAGGNLAKGLNEYANLHNIDLILIGSHGAGGKSEYFLGSNAQRIVRCVHCPVLVIKNRLEDINFERVVFASGFNENDRAPFLKFKELVRPFLPEIHLVAIHTHSFFDPPYMVSKAAMEEFKDLCAPFHCETHIYRDLNIDRGIRGFANDIGAKLICISNHFRHPLKRMLIGSNVEALVNHADQPVLSIDYVEIEEKDQTKSLSLSRS